MNSPICKAPSQFQPLLGIPAYPSLPHPGSPGVVESPHGCRIRTTSPSSLLFNFSNTTVTSFSLNSCKGPTFGAAVESLLGMHTSHIGVPGFESRLWLRFQLPADVHLGGSRRWIK